MVPTPEILQLIRHHKGRGKDNEKQDLLLQEHMCSTIKLISQSHACLDGGVGEEARE